MDDGKKLKGVSATELQDVGSDSDFAAVTAAAEQYGQDANVLFKQTRTRRLFSTAQLVAFSMLYMGTWSAVVGNVYAVLLNGGIAAWLWGFILVVIGVLAQVLTFCELASIQPVAGAQYYWTHHFAPARQKLFLTWVQGWCTWFGYVVMLAGFANGNALAAMGTISLSVEVDWNGWRTTLFIFALMAFATLINLFAFRLVPWFELVVGVINFVLFLVEMVVVWAVAPRNDISILMDTADGGSGWDSYFLRFNIGALSIIWLFVAFEGPIHMGEETRNPKRSVPRALLWGMMANFAMGFVMLFTFALALPPIDVVMNSVYPVPVVLFHATRGHLPSTLALLAFHFIKDMAGLIGSVSSCSRLTWAWARDGGLPRYFALVDGRTRIPFRAVIGTSGLIFLLVLLNLSDESYVAFNALLSLACLSIYSSYVIVICCLLHSRYRGDFKAGVWNLGRAGVYINGFALLYTCYEIIWLPFPTTLPVTPANMNWAGPVFGAVLIGSIGYWFLWAKNGWAGPNKAIVDIVLKNDEGTRRHAQ